MHKVLFNDIDTAKTITKSTISLGLTIKNTNNVAHEKSHTNNKLAIK